MCSIPVRVALVVAIAVAMSSLPGAQKSAGTSELGPTFQYIGPLAVGPDDVLFAADAQDVSIYALQLGKHTQGGQPGTKDIPNIDRQIAALLGTDAADIVITDMAVYPKTRNTFISVMRGQGTSAKAVLVRVDGAGTINVVPFDQLHYSKVKLPSPPGKITPLPLAGGRELPIPNYPDKPKTDGALNLFGVQTITDMAYYEGRLYVAGLSNEEFASTLRAIPFPFKTVANGPTSVEIYHGSHARFETMAPVRTFVSYKIGNEMSLLAAYTCTPLVRFPISDLKAGAKVVRFARSSEPGTTGFVEQPVALADVKPGWIVSAATRHEGEKEVAELVKVVLER